METPKMTHALGSLIGKIAKHQRTQEERDAEKLMHEKLNELFTEYMKSGDKRHMHIEDVLTLMPPQNVILYIRLTRAQEVQDEALLDKWRTIGKHFSTILGMHGITFKEFKVRFCHEERKEGNAFYSLKIHKEEGDNGADPFLCDIAMSMDFRGGLTLIRSRELPSGNRYAWGKGVNFYEVK